MKCATFSLQLHIFPITTIFKEVIEVCAAKIFPFDIPPHGLHRAVFFVARAEAI